MNLSRLLLLAALALLAAGCGSDAKGRSSSSRDTSSTQQTAPKDDGPVETVPSQGEGDRSATTTFSLTPAITRCMEQAGFTQDAPPTGGLAAWRHPSGGRVVVGSDSGVSVGIASEIGTAQRPADVDGAVVIAASEAETAAARACLD